MAPIVHGIEAEYHKDLNVSYLDIDDPATEELKRELGYRVQPHFFLLDGNGNIIEQWVGVVEEDTFREVIENNISQ